MRDLTYDVVSLIVKTLTFRNYCYVIVSMIHKTLWSPSFCGSLYTHNTSTAANNTSPCQALHSGIAICSPLSPTPTFWNAGIFWNHSRPSLQSQSPLQACRLSLNAPGCPAISVRTPHCRTNQCTSNSDAYRLMTPDCARKMQTQSCKLLSPKWIRGHEWDLQPHSPPQTLLAMIVSVREAALRTTASCSHCVFLFCVKDHKVQLGPRTHSVQLICTT